MGKIYGGIFCLALLAFVAPGYDFSSYILGILARELHDGVGWDGLIPSGIDV